MIEGTRAARWLRFALRFDATVLGLAFLAVLMPSEWMEASNRALGLDPLPKLPLVQYLTRSIAMLYGLYGSLSWITSTDLERYAPIITYMGCGNVLFGAVVGVIDWKAGMPLFWTLGESLPTMAMGGLILTLQRWERRGRGGRVGEQTERRRGNES